MAEILIYDYIKSWIILRMCLEANNSDLNINRSILEASLSFLRYDIIIPPCQSLMNRHKRVVIVISFMLIFTCISIECLPLIDILVIKNKYLAVLHF